MSDSNSDTPAGVGFHTPSTMTPAEIGDSLAQLVWEHFSDFIADSDPEVALTDLGVDHDEGVPDPHATEEALIFLLWAHTRGAQLAFLGRQREDLVRKGLDALHRAVFEDMIENGTPRSYLPIFEQRVGARYAEYHQAAERSNQALGSAVLSHLTGRRAFDDALALRATERALAVAEPLRDFLDDVEIVED